MEDEAAEARKNAEEKLQEGKNKLKPPTEIQEKQRLPTADDINAEQSAQVTATELLMEGRKSLKSTTTEERNRLPSASDIQAEKKDSTKRVSQSGQMNKAAESRKAAEGKSMGLGNVDAKSLAVGGAGAGGDAARAAGGL